LSATKGLISLNWFKNLETSHKKEYVSGLNYLMTAIQKLNAVGDLH